MTMQYPELSGNRFFITPKDPNYPKMFYELEDPPDIYVLGDPKALEEPGVSVIGARKATPYGIACARMAARCAVEHGLTVVSGAAMGCDQAGQIEAMRRGGRVVCVLGTGANVAYPKSSYDLLTYAATTPGCAVISLLPWDSQPQRWAFKKRNELIAAASLILVVCEAGCPSGTMSTCEVSDMLGHTICVFPGSVFSPNSAGSNMLIQQGAQVFLGKDDLDIAFTMYYGSMCLRSPREQKPSGGEEDNQEEPLSAILVKALMASPMKLGDISAGLEYNAIDIMRELSALEIQGTVVRLTDGRYSISENSYLRSANE
ncbi:MAG: DNA-processing protein DprA [Coriobacteriales bacterium]|nr:DNA-processing protein DprA [Coriobacteriales bacterium]